MPLEEVYSNEMTQGGVMTLYDAIIIPKISPLSQIPTIASFVSGPRRYVGTPPHAM